MKLCKDCRHIRLNEADVATSECGLGTYVNLVDGATRYKLCSTERSGFGACGGEGKRWEPANETVAEVSTT